MEARGEKLLQDLVDHEKALVTKVEKTKAEAAAIIDRAQTEAESIRAGARERADTLAREQAAATQAQTDRVRADIVERAQGEARELEAKAKTNVKAAVKLVVERVVP